MQIKKVSITKERKMQTTSLGWGNTNNVFFGKKNITPSSKFFPPEKK